MGKTNIQLVEKIFEDVWNRESVYTLMKIISNKFTYRQSATSQIELGPLALLKTIELYKSFMPGLKMKITEIHQHDKLTVVEWVGMGLHEGTSCKIQPSYKSISLQGASVFEIEDGKFISCQSDWDGESLVTQIGISKAELNSFPNENCVSLRSEGKNSGPPLVAIPSMSNKGWGQWYNFTRSIKAERTVVTADMIGVKCALMGLDPHKDYSAKWESKSLKNALIGSGFNFPIDLVSFSVGGVIALDFALDNPELVRSLTLIEPEVGWVFGENYLSQPTIGEFITAEDNLFRGDVSAETWFQAVRLFGVASPDFKLEEDKYWSEVSIFAKALKYRPYLYKNVGNVEKLKTLKVPTLIIKGTSSPIYFQLIADRLSEILPSAKLIQMDGYHGPHLFGKLDLFIGHLTRFHSELETTTASRISA